MNKFVLWVGIHIYSIILETAKIIVIFLDIIGLKFSKWHFRERFAIPRKIKNNHANPLIWIHGASLGEVKILNTFLPIIERKYPDHFFVLTAVTETGVNYLSNYQSEKVYAKGYLPVDSVFLMKKMLKKYQICRLWIIETELWPSMLWTCQNRKISIGMINARIEKKSYSYYKLLQFFLEPLFKEMDMILVQDMTYLKRFKSLGALPHTIHVIGNIKSQRAIKPPSQTKKNNMRLKLNISPNDTVITVGCLHPDEAPVIQKAIEILRSRGYIWKWLIIPRHIHKANTIREKLNDSVLSVTGINISREWTVCLMEALGILEDMYMIADVSVLGGTFNKVGGHNIWEAVQYGMPVIFGPNFHTQRQSYNRIISAGLGFVVQTSDDLVNKLIYTLIENPLNFSSAISNFINLQNNNTLLIEKYI